MLFAVKRSPAKNQKKLCVIRYGAWGDAIMISPVFKYYHQDGWHITLNCTQKCYDVLNTNPYIDAFIIQSDGEIPIDKLNEHWNKLIKQFDKVINFTGSIENRLLISPGQKEYLWDKEKLHEHCNINYYDHTMKLAGYSKKKGELGEIYFTQKEEQFVKKLKEKYEGFLIVWCLTGSAIHKIYPWTENIINVIIERIPESYIILVGEPACKGLIDKNERIIDLCSNITIRESFILTKYVDLVISTETSVLVAAGCFDTPKVALLSHGSEENLTKYYKNCSVVRENVPCSPCHKLHYSRDTCPLVNEINHPICMGLLHPKKILDPIEKIYIEWREKNVNTNTTD